MEYLKELDKYIITEIHKLNQEIISYTSEKNKSRVIPYYQHAKGKLEAFLEMRIKVKELKDDLSS